MERVLDEAKGPHQQTRNKRCREDVELIPEPHTSRATGLGRSAEGSSTGKQRGDELALSVLIKGKAELE